MKIKKVLAVVLSAALSLSSVLFVSAAPALVPPANSAVKVVADQMTKKFNAQGDTWDSWDTQGVTATKTFVPNAMDNGNGAVEVKGNFPFIILDGFGSSFSSYQEIKMYVKSNSQTTISFKERYSGIVSDSYTIPSTNGAWKQVTLLPSYFYGKTETSINEEGYKSIKSKYNAESGAYDSVAMMYVNSTDVLIGDIVCTNYEYTTESSIVRTSISSDFNKATWGSWGSWTGGGSTQVPFVMEYVENGGESGDAKVLHMAGGNTGAGSYAGGQVMMSNSFDLSGADAIRIKYKSTKSITAMFNLTFQSNAGATIPERYREFLATNAGAMEKIDSDWKVTEYLKVELKSKGQSLPSTNEQWQTIDLPMSKFGDQGWLKFVVTNIANQDFLPSAMLRFEGTTFGASGYCDVEQVEGIWYEKRPTMSAISFKNDGANSNEGIDEGTTDVSVTLANDAAVDCEGVLLIVSLYDTVTNKLVDISVKKLTVPAQNTLDQTLSVTIPSGEAYENYKCNVMLWDGEDTIDQITNLAILDGWGYSTETSY